MLFTIATFFLSNASGRQQRWASASVPGQRTATHVTNATAAFAFSPAKELVRPPVLPIPGGVVSLKDQDLEPEIKVDLFGNIYITAIHGVPGGVDLWKSTDKGATFVYMGEPDGAQDKCDVMGTSACTAGAGGGDDSIDVSSGGYLYVSSLYLGGITMSTSYDGGTGGIVEGQKWEVHPASSGIPVNDREWVAAYGPQTLYMTFDQAPAPGPLWFTKSTDAGKTFSPPVMLTGVSALSRENNLVVDQYNGNIYTTFTPAGSSNQIKLLKSTDGGATWMTTTAFTGAAGTCVENSFPILAVDKGGNLHLVFTQSFGCGPTPARINAHVYLTSSTDQGATWLPPVQVDAGSNSNSTVMPWVVAGSAGVVDITWYGSSSSSPDTAPFDWHVFFAQTTNALSGSPLFTQVLASPNQVHDDAICSRGSACTGATRDLAEYYTMTIDPDGNANIAFVDGITDCVGPPTSNCYAKTWYTKQISGPSAYAPPAAPVPASFAANLVMPGSTGDAEPNMRADSHNCLYSGAPGAPDAWKSTDAGASFFKLPNPVVSAGAVAGGGDSEIVTFPQPNGARSDQIYYADLAVASVNISKSIDGGATWFSPGTGGSAGEVSASTDRQWMSADRNGANQTIYLWEHEFVSQILRMNALTNDSGSPGPPDTRSGGPWSPFANGMTDPELVALASTVGNTVPGPTFVDSATHQVYGFLSASTPSTNAIGAPTGKLPNVWEADGPGTFTPGVPPGPFTNHPVFKGVLDSPANPAPPAGARTVGSNTANLFNGAAIDAAGNIYASWATPNARTGLYDVWFASSHDHGKTFYGPFKINQNVTQGNMPWIAAGDNGRVDIVFYGSADTQDPTTSTIDKWSVYFAQSLNAADREPVFSAVQASDHIMHQGPICNVGILCGSGTRQLLDFFQVAIGPDGMANIAYADTGAGNGTPHISYARQNGGPSAVANPSGVTCLPGAPIPLKVVSQKTHGPAGTFDVPLPPSPHGIECRTGQPAANQHKVVFTFPVPVTVTNASISSGSGSVNSTTVSGNTVTVNLTAANAQKIVIKLTGVNDSSGNAGDISWPMDILLADVNASTAVDSGDVFLLQQQNGQALPPTGSADFRRDINLNGAIDSGDVFIGQKQNPSQLPP